MAVLASMTSAAARDFAPSSPMSSTKVALLASRVLACSFSPVRRRRIRHREDRRRSGRRGRIARHSARGRRVMIAMRGREWRRPRRRSGTGRRSSSPACAAHRQDPSGMIFLRIEIEHLAAGHAVLAGGAGEFGDELARIAASGWVSGRLRISKAKVRSASPARMAVASSKARCNGRAAAAQIVIVHGGKIVMDERIAMHAFKRRADAQGALAAARRKAARSRSTRKGPQALSRRPARHSAWPRRARRGPLPASSRSSRASVAAAAGQGQFSNFSGGIDAKGRFLC